jgi:arylsulfatase A-like enzyme
MYLGSVRIVKGCGRRRYRVSPARPAEEDLKLEKKPHLVYILADQLRLQSCGYADDRLARTPNLDRLALKSVSFSQAVSGHPVCAPYRASLFTGKYSSSTAMVINELRVSPDHECLAHVLNAQGYETAYIGKWHLWANELGNHDDPKNSHIPAGPYRLGFDGLWAAYNFHHDYYDAYYHTDGPGKIVLKGYEPDGQTDLAIDFLKRAKNLGKPLALFLSYGTPHDPWTRHNVPDRYYEMFSDASFPKPPNYLPDNDSYADGWARFRDNERERLEEWMRIYYGMTANLDENLGRLLSALADAGLVENTLFVFTSDHGEMFGAHGRRGKNIFYEEAIRVPFLVRWPGRVPEGGTTDACLSAPDIMPTLLALMGLPVPQGVEGMDLSSRALGREGPQPECAFLQGMGSTAAWIDGHEWRAVRTKRYTYAVYRRDGRELLFDNVADPFQQSNLMGDAARIETVSHLRELLKKRMAALDDSFESCTWYRDHWIEDRIIRRSATLSPR